jgi:glucosamine--fructose-6-phosphate aminotransferase (isomerizing)
VQAGGRTQLEREIREQGSTLAARTARGWGEAERAAELIRSDDVNQVVIAARGTSDNAARYAQYLFGLDARLPVALATPWLYGDSSPPLLRGAAVVGISQSGRSPDIVSVARVAREQGRPTIAITNDERSPLALSADVVVPMHAGPELSVAATKTYLASLHAIAQISELLCGQPDRLAWFERLPELVSGFVEQLLSARDRFDALRAVSAVTVVGRGLQLATAFETALKLRELSAIPAEAFSLADLMHGPVAALSPSGSIWLIATAGRQQPGLTEFAALRSAVGTSVAVSDDPEVLTSADVPVAIDRELPPWVAPFVSAIPGQVAALRLGELLGVDVDRPHGLHKVTLTT